MTTYVFDSMTSGPTDVGPPALPLPFFEFLRGGGSGDQERGQTFSPSGDYVAGGASQAQAWVAKITPAGSPSLAMNTILNGVTWDNNDVGFVDQDMEMFNVDDDGFIWGQSYIWGTSDVFPLGSRQRGVVGYVDPSNAGHIVKAFSWDVSGTASSDDPHAGFIINQMFNFTLPDGTIKIIVLPDGLPPGQYTNVHFYEHTKGTTTATTHTLASGYSANFAFQDDNKDIWVAATDGTTTNILFTRITDVTGSSPYTTPQTVAGPAFSTSASPPVGYFAGTAFVGGWREDGVAGGTCETLFSIDLTTQAVTSADTSSDPLVLPRYPSLPNPTYYAVAKLSDCINDGAEPGYQSRIFYNLGTGLTLGTSYNLDTWAAGDIGGDDTSHQDDVYTVYWSEGRQAFFGIRNLATGDGTIQGDLFIYYFGSGGGGGGGTGGIGSTTIRCWGYKLDGHTHIVWRLGDTATLVFDRQTRQWSAFQSPERTNWRPHVGQSWLGMASTTFANGFGTDIVGGDDSSGVLWVLDPTTGIDDKPDTGTETYTRTVTGGIQVVGRDSVACNAVTLDLALASPTQTGAAITLNISDDLGNSWINCGANTIAAGNHTATVEWRALGNMKAPGRLFQLTDNGASVRLSGLNMR